MRLSRLADYAIVAMTYVAREPERVHAAVEIASATNLPAPAASKVLARLCRAGLVTSVRGTKGGYRLARAAEDISVGAIVHALDGAVAITQCIKSGRGGCEIEVACPSRSGLNRINVAVKKALDDVSLADIAQRAFLAPNRPAVPNHADYKVQP
jgi:FeS assembly SUF system regulator